MTTTLAAPLTSGENPDTEVRDEFAIKLPNRQWYRTIAAVLRDPDGVDPSIYRTKDAVHDELFNVRTTAVALFGPRRYMPRVWTRTVRVNIIGEATVSEWVQLPFDMAEVGEK